MKCFCVWDANSHLCEHLTNLTFLYARDSWWQLLLLLLSHFSRVQLCETPEMAAHQAPPGILQARTLEWVAISFSKAGKWKVKLKLLSHVRLLATPWTAANQAPLSMGFSRQEYWSGVPLPSLKLWSSNNKFIASLHLFMFINISGLYILEKKVKSCGWNSEIYHKNR